MRRSGREAAEPPPWTDTVSKVIQQSAGGRASAALPPPPIVNNFAADKLPAVNNLAAPAHAGDGSASDGARSPWTDLTKVRRRAPVRPQASTPRSDRTQAHEAPVSVRPRGRQSRRAQPPTRTKKVTPHEELTHYAGFDWAKDHHDVIIVDAKGKIVADFQIAHSAAGWKAWQEKTAAFARLGGRH